jgi:hypothetical protein
MHAVGQRRGGPVVEVEGQEHAPVGFPMGLPSSSSTSRATCCRSRSAASGRLLPSLTPIQRTLPATSSRSPRSGRGGSRPPRTAPARHPAAGQAEGRPVALDRVQGAAHPRREPARRGNRPRR